MKNKLIQYYILASYFPDDTIQYIAETSYTPLKEEALHFNSKHKARLKKFELQKNNIDVDIDIIEVSVSLQNQNKLIYKLVQ